MPYTPPAQQSPAVSRPESPPRSRDSTGVKPLPSSSPFFAGPRPNLPRSSSSTSYLHRHRRSPHPSSDLSMSPKYEAYDWAQAPHASLRQSPPPVNSNKMPTGVVISPPDSENNSSDDEGITMPNRNTRLNNLEDLKAAITAIDIEREGRPNWAEEEKQNHRAALGLDTDVVESPISLQLPSSNGRPPLSKEARKISHSRSSTETMIQLPRSQSYSPQEGSSDSDLDEDAANQKPKMLRKKSGELVRPALRPASARRRPSSMPGTPTFSKAVHFSSDLEHVRHFLQVDRPLAVSAETSPVETYDDEHEYPFPDESESKPSYEWEIRLANFSADTAERNSQPVKVERVFLSSNKKTLIGTVAVQNLAFHKAVVARFTFDYWKTTSEITAEFSHDVRREQPGDGLDRFNFNLQLADQTNLENKTLFFCVRYSVNGQEFWDSNNMINYQVDFTKKLIPAKSQSSGKNEATQHINGLPRSSRSPQQSPSLRKNFDDFGLGFDSQWNAKAPLPRAQSANSLLVDDSNTPLKFRSKASGNALEDLPGRRQAKGAAQPLGNRYDFNKSLVAALTAANSALGERSGLSSPLPADKQDSTKAKSSWLPSELLSPTASSAALAASQITPTPSPSALSYDEIVEKYCFFGTGKGASTRSNQATPPQARSESNVAGEAGSHPQTPSPAVSPSQSTTKPAVESVSRHLPSSVSPSQSEISSRAASPSFGYPYHQSMGNAFASSPAIRG